ncbi:MAG: hypothetical protein AB7O28_26795 [Vicinamibacterales bacterium]
MRLWREGGARIVMLGLVSAVLAADAAAQTGPRGAPPPAPPPTDFMLGRPKGFIALEGGFLFANAGSDLYEFVTTQLTLDKRSFNTPVIGGRLGWAVTPSLDVAVLYERAQSSTPSEYRDFVDNDLLPIEQTTERKEDHVGLSIRWSLVPAGRRISRFAWIPRTVTPYVGGGAGAVRYQFRQYGSFVDFQTQRIFDSTFASEGWAPSAHALAGVDVRVYRRLYVGADARYTWSRATLGADFVDFEPISLAGLRVGGSLKMVF